MYSINGSRIQYENKLLGKRIMANAEAANAIQSDQFGGRKKHKAMNACLNKVLINDIFRQKKTCCGLWNGKCPRLL